jgi:hypothetical protein
MANAFIKNLITTLLLWSIFITGEGIITEPFRLYWYYPLYAFFIAYCLVVYHRLDFRIVLTILFIIVYTLLTFKSGFPLVVKQLVNVSFSLLVFSFLIIHEDRDLPKLFAKYIKVAKVVALLGLVQVVMFAGGIGHWYVKIFPWLRTYDVQIRLQSITQEPSYIALTFAPIVFVSVHNLFFKKKEFISKTWSLIFIAVYLLTGSSIAFAGLMVIMMLVYFKYITYTRAALAWVALAGVLGLGVLIYNTNTGVKMRVDDTITALSMDNFFANENYKEVNLSTFTLLTNFYISMDAVAAHPLFGNGLGTYELIFDASIPPGMSSYRGYNMNREDAAAILLRLLAETGIVGTGIFLYFAFRHKCRARLSMSPMANIYWLLNSGFFVLLLLAILRNGNYTTHGKMLFFMMYFYSWMEYRRASPKESASPGIAALPST